MIMSAKPPPGSSNHSWAHRRIVSVSQRCGAEYVSSLKPILQKCRPGSKEQPLAEQIIDHTLRANPDLYDAYDQARVTVGRCDPYGSPDDFVSYCSSKDYLSSFMRQWIASEKLLADNLHKYLNGEAPQHPRLDEEAIEKLRSARKIRDDILFGTDLPGESETLRAKESLQEILEFMGLRGDGSKIHDKEA